MATHIMIVAPSGANVPSACRDAAGDVLPTEEAERERPLPRTPDCLCVYAPHTPSPPLP